MQTLGWGVCSGQNGKLGVIWPLQSPLHPLDSKPHPQLCGLGDKVQFSFKGRSTRPFSLQTLVRDLDPNPGSTIHCVT